jgi:hypothetical protein
MGVLLMLMTIGGLLTAVILLIVAVVSEKGWLRNFVIGGVAVWFVFYAAMLFGFSLTSTEKVLAAGEAKEYCGFYLDCHMHTAVDSVRRTKSIGGQTANGIFYVVDVRVFSDARDSIIKLDLIEPKARIVLPNGEKIERNMTAESTLPTANVQLDQKITNSQRIEKEIVFDVPTDAVNAKLLITEGYGIDKTIEHVLVGDEDSLFHAQTFFELKEQNETAGVK